MNTSPNAPPHPFGRLVEAARNQRGWSQARLAHESRVSASNLSRVLKGEREGNGPTIARLARALDLDPAAVLACFLDEPIDEPDLGTPATSERRFIVEVDRLLTEKLQSVNLSAALPADEEELVALIRRRFAADPEVSPLALEKLVQAVYQLRRRDRGPAGE